MRPAAAGGGEGAVPVPEILLPIFFVGFFCRIHFGKNILRWPTLRAYKNTVFQVPLGKSFFTGRIVSAVFLCPGKSAPGPGVADEVAFASDKEFF
jgi:hypothetical protein